MATTSTKLSRLVGASNVQGEQLNLVVKHATSSSVNSGADIVQAPPDNVVKLVVSATCSGTDGIRFSIANKCTALTLHKSQLLDHFLGFFRENASALGIQEISEPEVKDMHHVVVYLTLRIFPVPLKRLSSTSAVGSQLDQIAVTICILALDADLESTESRTTPPASCQRNLGTTLLSKSTSRKGSPAGLPKLHRKMVAEAAQTLANNLARRYPTIFSPAFVQKMLDGSKSWTSIASSLQKIAGRSVPPFASHYDVLLQCVRQQYRPSAILDHNITTEESQPVHDDPEDPRFYQAIRVSQTLSAGRQEIVDSLTRALYSLALHRSRKPAVFTDNCPAAVYTDAISPSREAPIELSDSDDDDRLLGQRYHYRPERVVPPTPTSRAKRTGRSIAGVFYESPVVSSSVELVRKPRRNAMDTAIITHVRHRVKGEAHDTSIQPIVIGSSNEEDETRMTPQREEDIMSSFSESDEPHPSPKQYKAQNQEDRIDGIMPSSDDEDSDTDAASLQLMLTGVKRHAIVAPAPACPEALSQPPADGGSPNEHPRTSQSQRKPLRLASLQQEAACRGLSLKRLSNSTSSVPTRVWRSNNDSSSDEKSLAMSAFRSSEKASGYYQYVESPAVQHSTHQGRKRKWREEAAQQNSLFSAVSGRDTISGNNVAAHRYRPPRGSTHLSQLSIDDRSMHSFPDEQPLDLLYRTSPASLHNEDADIMPSSDEGEHTNDYQEE